MMLLITPSSRGPQIAAAIERATGKKVELASDLRKGLALLRGKEYSAVAIDFALLEHHSSADVLLEHLGVAFPIYLNIALSGTKRIVSEVRLGLRRAQRERAIATKSVQEEMRAALNTEITSILLFLQLAMELPGVPRVATQKLKLACEMAQRMKERLG